MVHPLCANIRRPFYQLMDTIHPFNVVCCFLKCFHTGREIIFLNHDVAHLRALYQGHRYEVYEIESRHLFVWTVRAYGSQQGIPKSGCLSHSKVLAHKEHEPPHRVKLVRHIVFYYHIVNFRVYVFENLIVMVHVTFKT